MFKIYRRLIEFLRAFAEPVPPRDPLAGLTAREWADLPVHHPRCD